MKCSHKLPQFICLTILALSMGFVTPGTAVAQPDPVGPLDTPYVFKEWNNHNGLPINSTSSILQDELGYLWVGTEAGLVRFNGRDFTTYNPANTPGMLTTWVYRLTPSTFGGLWASTAFNLIRVKNQELTVYNMRDHLPELVRITAIKEDEAGRVWIGTNSGGLYIFQETELHKAQGWSQHTTGAIHTITKTSSSGLYIGTARGFYHHDKTADEPTLIIDNIYVEAVTETTDGVIWVGTYENGLYEITENKIRNIGAEQGLADKYIYSLMPGSDGSLWVSTYPGEVQVLKDDTFTRLNAVSSQYSGTYNLYQGQDDHIWFSTTDYGLVLMKKGRVQNLTMDKGLNGNLAYAIYQHHNGDIWIGTDGPGINRIQDGKITHITESDGLLNNYVLGVYGVGEYIYIYTYEGLNRFNIAEDRIDKSFSIEDGLADNWVTIIYPDSQDRVWVVTPYEGIHLLNNGTFEQFSIPDAFAEAYFETLFEDRRGSIWFGAGAEGILKLDATGSFYEYPLQNHFPVEVVLDFYEDPEGDIWIATDNGLLLKTEEGFTHYNTDHGFQSNTIYRILADDQHLWMSGFDGIQRLSIPDLLSLKGKDLATAHIPVQMIDDSDGMLNKETNGGIFPAGWRLQDGTLWFPTIEGVAIINPEEFTSTQSRITTFIEHVRFGDEQYTAYQKVTIPAGVHNFEIKYTTLNYSKPHTINYFYRIKAISEDWISTSNRNIAYFVSMDPGSYTFEVKAEQFGLESEVTTLQLMVEPFFYQTNWFSVLMLSGLFLSGYFVHLFYAKHRSGLELGKRVEEQTKELLLRNEELKYAITNIENQNTVLKQVAWVQSHEIRGPLSRILGLVDVVKNYDQFKTVNKDKAELIDEISESALELDSILRRLNADMEELENMDKE